MAAKKVAKKPAKGKAVKKITPKAKPAKAAKKAVKKIVKPVKKVVKPAKKVVKPAKKVAKPAKKANKPVKKVVSKSVKAKPVSKKPIPKKVVKVIKKAIPKKPAAKKPAPKKLVVKKVLKPIAKKPIAKVVKKVETKKNSKQAPVIKTVKVAAQPKKQITPAAKAVHPVVKATPLPVAKPAAIKASIQKDEPLEPIISKPIIKPLEKKDSSMADVRYPDKDLKEFDELIRVKLAAAQIDMDELKQSLSHEGDNSTDDTAPTFKMMEDGSETMNREELSQLANRQEKFIQNLENALLRIKNKTYGICRVTGKLIPKERLRLVPHATLSIEAKNMQ